MAGDWIKLEHATLDKPELSKLARLLGESRGDTLMLLLRFWVWLDQTTGNGLVTQMYAQDIDDLIRCPGFCLGLQSVGWLKVNQDGLLITITHFDRHNGKTAKIRALTSKRVKAHRVEKGQKTSNARVTQSALPEKRREDIYTKPTHARTDTTSSSPPAESPAKPENHENRRDIYPFSKPETEPRKPELPKPTKPAHGWWRSQAGCDQFQAWSGVKARPGESMDDYRGRAEATLQANQGCVVAEQKPALQEEAAADPEDRAKIREAVAPFLEHIRQRQNGGGTPMSQAEQVAWVAAHADESED